MQELLRKLISVTCDYYVTDIAVPRIKKKTTKKKTTRKMSDEIDAAAGSSDLISLIGVGIRKESTRKCYY